MHTLHQAVYVFRMCCTQREKLLRCRGSQSFRSSGWRAVVAGTYGNALLVQQYAYIRRVRGLSTRKEIAPARCFGFHPLKRSSGIATSVAATAYPGELVLICLYAYECPAVLTHAMAAPRADSLADGGVPASNFSGEFAIGGFGRR